MSDELRADLVNKLKQDPKSVVFVVGAGVTMGALYGSGKPTSWGGLIKDGLDFAKARSKFSPGEYEACLHKLGSKAGEDWIDVAQTLTDKLGGVRGGEFRNWLQKSVGTFRESIRDRSVLDPLAELAKRGALLLTTNYDHVLEQVTGLPTVVGTDSGRMGEALRDRPAILHMHGSWERPASVVLGAESYQEVLDDAFAQFIMRALPATKTLVFIGCGAGLQDPNWGPFMSWVEDVLVYDTQEHYRLCREGERQQVADEHQGQPIYPLVFGTEHGDLGGFLQGLVSELPALPVAQGKDVTRFGLLVNIGFPKGPRWRPVTHQELLRRVGADIEESNIFEMIGEYAHTSDAIWSEIRARIDREVSLILARAKQGRAVELHIAGKAWPSVWGYLGSSLRHSGIACIIHHVHGETWVTVGPEQARTHASPGAFKPGPDIRQKETRGIVSLGINCAERDYQEFYFPEVSALIKSDGGQQVATYTISRPGKMTPDDLSACLAGIFEALDHPGASGFTVGFAGPTWVLFWLGNLWHPTADIDFIHFRGMTAKPKYEYGLSTSQKHRVRGAVRVLLIGAEPEGQTSVEVSREFKAIRKALSPRVKDSRMQVSGNRVEIEEIVCATRSEVRDKLKQFKPHIIHVSCHGEENGLAFVGKSGATNVVRGEQLAEYLAHEGHRPELVFLSACHSYSLVEGLKDKARVLLAYPGVANTKSSYVFVESFYTRLCTGDSVEEARKEADLVVDERLHQNDPCEVGSRYELSYGAGASSPVNIFSPVR